MLELKRNFQNNKSRQSCYEAWVTVPSWPSYYCQ